MRDSFGKMIDEQLCPRCDRVRTVRLEPAYTCACLECGHRWKPKDGAAEPVDEPLDVRLGALFTPFDLARLAAYRAAVRIGFYHEWC
jgi:hypothetical protein